MIMNVKFDNEEIMNLLQQAKEQIDALRTTTMRLNAVLGIQLQLPHRRSRKPVAWTLEAVGKVLG